MSNNTHLRLNEINLLGLANREIFKNEKYIGRPRLIVDDNGIPVFTIKNYKKRIKINRKLYFRNVDFKINLSSKYIELSKMLDKIIIESNGICYHLSYFKNVNGYYNLKYLSQALYVTSHNIRNLRYLNDTDLDGNPLLVSVAGYTGGKYLHPLQTLMYLIFNAKSNKHDGDSIRFLESLAFGGLNSLMLDNKPIILTKLDEDDFVVTRRKPVGFMVSENNPVKKKHKKKTKKEIEQELKDEQIHEVGGFLRSLFTH